MSTATETPRERLYRELSEARTDAHNLSNVALLREARLAGIRELGTRHEMVEAVARAWTGIAT